MQSEDFARLLSVLQANGVNCNDKLESAYISEGCREVYRAQFDGLVDDMQAYLYMAANSPRGFSRRARRDLAAMADLVVRISEADMEHFDAVSSACKKVRGNAQKKILKGSNGTDMKNEVLKKVAAYKAAVGVLRGMDIATDRKGILDEITAKLSKLEATLNGVVDSSSAEALDRAKAIVSELESWGVNVSNFMHNENTPAELDAIITVAERWASQQQVKRGLFGSRKPVDYSEIRFDGDRYDTADPMERIAQSAVHIRSVTTFERTFADFQRANEKRYNTTALEEKQTALEERQRKLTELEDELVAQFNNGAIDKDEFDRRADDLVDESDDILDSLEEVRSEIAAKAEFRRTHGRLTDHLKKLLDFIHEFEETDLATIAMIGERIDFNKLSTVMTGNMGQADAEALSELTSFEADLKEITSGNLAALAGELRKQREIERARRDQQRQEREAARAKRQEENAARTGVQRESAGDRLLKRRGQQVPQQPVAPQEQPQEQPQEDLLDTITNPNGVRR